MKRLFAILGCFFLVAVLSLACNKKCTCVTTNPAVVVVDTISYKTPISKHQCQQYQDNQNSLLNAVDGKVTCVYE